MFRRCNVGELETQNFHKNSIRARFSKKFEKNAIYYYKNLTIDKLKIQLNVLKI